MTKITEHSFRVTTIAPTGRIDAFNAPDLRAEIHALLDDGVVRLIIDLQNVTFCDSAAMAVLVSALKRARQANGDVKLVWPIEKNARRIFTLTKFDRVFDMTESASDALAAFGG